MTAGDMSGLMGEDADHLIGRLGARQAPGMHEDVVPVDDKGVEAQIVDEVNADALRADAGRVQDGLGVNADQRFDLGVTDEPLRIRRRRDDLSGGKRPDKHRAEPPRF